MTGPHRVGRVLVLCSAFVVLCLIVFVSLAVGAKPIALHHVWIAIWEGNRTYDAGIILDQRLPRTLVGVLCGIALGLAGAVMQALTRNPLADPGILGVNAGAAASMVTVITFAGFTQFHQFIWFSFLGAASVAIFVYLVASIGRGSSPIRLALAGTAISVTLGSYTSFLNYMDSQTYDRIRFWLVGSLAGQDITKLVDLAPFLLFGVAVTMSIGSGLNAVTLGDDQARALGANVARIRLLSAVSVTLLCGTATAIAGPIGFVGLAVPHLSRLIVGPDVRWILLHTVFLAPILVLGADVLGRIIADEEFQVGVITAWVGAPVLIGLARGRKISAP